MPKRPNLLFIFTDEQRFDTLGCYGNKKIRTPNLDALADRSVVFENAYVTQSVCTPSRSTIMTGLYPHTNGCTANNIPLRPDTPTLAEMVSDEYLCGYFGKWHLGDEIIAQHGFSEWVSTEDMYRRRYSKEEYLSRVSTYCQFLLDQGLEPDQDRGGGIKTFNRSTVANFEEWYTKAAFTGREAARFIKENKDRPYALYINFLEPHMPFTGPLNDLYDPNDIPVGPHFAQEVPGNTSMKNRLMSALWREKAAGGQYATAEESWRVVRARYLGLCTMVDNAVGVILQALEESGRADNTIVAYTSDHGDMMGDHGMIAKCVQYEEAVKVPLLMSVPWMKTAGRAAGRISQIDLVPTLLELMQEEIPGNLEGRSRADVLCGDATLEGNDAFIEWNGANGLSSKAPILGKDPDDIKHFAGQPWRCIVSAEGWKMNLSPGDQCELYDLNTDPYEQTNRFEDPDQKERIRDLADRIRAWQQQTGDEAPLPPL